MYSNTLPIVFNFQNPIGNFTTNESLISTRPKQEMTVKTG